MNYIDIKYIRMLGPQLQQFKEKKNNVFQFRCPYCGDSKVSKTKARGYIYEKKGKINFRCHNCGESASASNFIKYVNPTLHEEYVVEKFKDKYKPKPKIGKLPFADKEKHPDHQDILQGIPALIELDSNHIASLYVEERLLPESSYYDMYYIDDINQLARKLPKYDDVKLDKSPRILLPFRNKDGIITHIQGRAISKTDKAHRYITLEIIPDQIKIFGEDRVNYKEVVFVVEGPIDSLFLNNAVAMGGADVDFHKFNKSKTIFVYDNEKTDEIINRMKKAVQFGFRVCIWGKDVSQYKDINDMMEKFKTSVELQNYILYHSKDGLSAELEITKFKKR